MKRSSDDWCRAEIASGESSAKANKRAARAFAFYSTATVFAWTAALVGETAVLGSEVIVSVL